MKRRPQPSDLDEMGAELVRQTAVISWSELARQQAGGNILAVAVHFDLIDIGRAMQADRSDLLATWLADGSVYRIDDLQAIEWQRENTQFWALVIAPFVVIQAYVKTPG